MITFFIAIALLIGGYFIYGKVIEKIFGPDDRPTPAITMEDGVDYVPMKPWRIFLIQLLNIAGLGPIFGALSGALWGPVVFLWIVFGTIFAGAVHDFFAGMISIRHKGCSIAEIIGIYLGKGMKNVMRVFSIVLMVLVGAVFATGPAGLLAMLTPGPLNTSFWLVVIIIYYFLATLLPIDKVIGKIYPIFGICLIVMAFGVASGIVLQGYTMPEITLANLHPKETAIWPVMFVTVACGAISGFHATQAPMMAKCMTSEKQGRAIFYGSMVAEGLIALIWAAAGVAFYATTGGLQEAMVAYGGQGGVVYEICRTLLGPLGSVLAMVGVIACPISSGDTAFRTARLIIAEWINYPQEKTKNRLLITIPLLAVGALLSQINFDIVWRYFTWSNQVLATITLWAISVYLYQHKKNFWVTVLPAIFMSAVISTYILMAEEGLRLSTTIAYPAGLIFAVACGAVFYFKTIKPKKNINLEA